MNFQTEWFDKLASTNTTLREQFFQGRKIHDGTLIATHEQTAGRGRLDRKWLSAAGQNLCFSLFVRTDTELATVPSLTMAAALAVNDLLRSMGIRSAPKWPNDVLVGGKKICGILSERVERTHPRSVGIIIGIGLNVNMSSEDAQAVDRPATSILIESGKAAPIAQMLEALLHPLAFWVDKWESGGFESLREIWTEKAGPLGKPLTVHDGAIKKSGTLAGFGKHGELLLQTDNGIETIWSGDVN